MTCPRCNKRPAKRQCPALRTKICAICCAAERMVELACPESCNYLKEARSEARSREAALRVKELKAGGSLDLGMNPKSMAAAYLTDQALIGAFRGTNGSQLSGLVDTEALGAVENAIKNLETEETGLIYRHPASTPRIEELSRRIRDGITKAFESEPPESRPRRNETVRGLKYVRDSISAHTQRPGADPRGYMRYVSLFCDWPEESVKPLII